MRVRIHHAGVRFEKYALAAPLLLSTGPVTHATVATASVTVEAGGTTATGHGSICLSELWSWPDPSVEQNTRSLVMRAWCEWIASELHSLCGDSEAHPLELGLRLNASLAGAGPLAHGQPRPWRLARAVCGSPFDAAIHDAAGIALSRSSFMLYDDNDPIPSADHLFPSSSASSAIRALMSPRSGTREAWLIVGPKDDFPGDVSHRIEERGYRRFKLKLTGDPAVDAEFTAAAFRAAGAREAKLCADSNCATPGVQGTVEYLERLRRDAPEAFGALQYIEQPAGRDLRRDEYDWRPVARIKPVLVDEGLTGLDILESVLEQGWSGLGLKTCKGHSLALTAAAWAKQRDLAVSLQDLTNPGYAALHAALFSGWVPTMNGLELNSPQYLPAANAQFVSACPDLFNPRRGVHALPPLNSVGLGSSLVTG